MKRLLLDAEVETAAAITETKGFLTNPVDPIGFFVKIQAVSNVGASLREASFLVKTTLVEAHTEAEAAYKNAIDSVHALAPNLSDKIKFTIAVGQLLVPLMALQTAIQRMEDIRFQHSNMRRE